MPTISGRNFIFKDLEISRDFELLEFNKTPDIIFPFTPTSLMISNESNLKTIFWSFNSIDVDGFLFKKETPITFDNGTWAKIHFAKETGGEPILIRVWAWRR